MNKTTIGWAWVAVQAVLLVTLVFLPSGNDWPRSQALSAAAGVLFFVGVAVMLISALRLGRSLTATPVPVAGGSMVSDGLYRWMRHPIYTGVMALVVAIALRSRSWPTVAVALATIAFFNLKARWEEARLAEHYPDYQRYAAVTSRFVPTPLVLRRTRPDRG
ncbi:MAG: isoprenylcysteine carboxylmethyltransferase family protein [Acidimicrobiales bacterium]